MKICPACEEPLKNKAIVCTHCGYRLEPIPAVADSGQRPTPNSYKVGCGILGILIVLATFLVFNLYYPAR